MEHVCRQKNGLFQLANGATQTIHTPQTKKSAFFAAIRTEMVCFNLLASERLMLHKVHQPNVSARNLDTSLTVVIQLARNAAFRC